MAAVDAYGAMITRRSYKEAYTQDHAREELSRGAGSQFDPKVVEALLAILESGEGRDFDSDFDAECELLPDIFQVRDDPAPRGRDARGGGGRELEAGA